MKHTMSSLRATKLLLLASCAALLRTVAEAVDTSRSITIMNESGRRVEIHWVHPNTGEMVLQTDPDILNGASMDLNSYVTHTFQVRELPAKKTKKCAGEGGECRIDHFTVNANKDQIVFIKEGIKTEHTDSKSVAAKSASNLLDVCTAQAKNHLAKGDRSRDKVLEELGECVEKGISSEIQRKAEEVAFQTEIRKEIARSWEVYTCADDKVNATEAKKEERWGRRKVGIMVDRPAVKIHVIEDFITEEECRAVERAAEPLLHDATVSDGKGGSILSDLRKARQAGIKVDWSKERSGDPIATLSRRVYEYVNHVLPFGIKENGQEDLMSIQYTGRGKGDEKPDQYMPHCDGDCNGLDFKRGNRVASIFMYCEVPTSGGATNFRNSGVHVKPKKYSATFFSYVDADTMKMDSGFSEHSGCPVVEGSKKIVAQWVRLGVDDANPWSAFADGTAAELTQQADAVDSGAVPPAEDNIEESDASAKPAEDCADGSDAAAPAKDDEDVPPVAESVVNDKAAPPTFSRLKNSFFG